MRLWVALTLLLTLAASQPTLFQLSAATSAGLGWYDPLAWESGNVPCDQPAGVDVLLWHDGVEATVYFTTGQTLCNAFASITLGNDTGSSHAWPPALFLDGTAGSTLLHVDNMVLLSGAITVLPSPTNQPVGLVVTRTLSASSVHTPSVAPFVGGLPSTSMALTVSAATLTISGHLGSLGSFSMASTNVSVSTLLLTNYASWSLSTICEVHAPVLHACPDCTVHLFGPTQFYVQSWTGGLLFGAAGSSVGFHGPVTMDNVTIYGDLTAFSTFLVVISDSVLVTGKLSATNTFFVQGQGAPRNRAMFNVTEGGLLYLHSAMVLSSPGQVLYAGPGAHVGMGRSTHVQLYAGTMVLDRVSEWYFDDKASLLLQEGTNLTLVSVPRLHWYVSPSLLLSPRITVGGNANIWLSGYDATTSLVCDASLSLEGGQFTLVEGPSVAKLNFSVQITLWTTLLRPPHLYAPTAAITVPSLLFFGGHIQCYSLLVDTLSLGGSSTHLDSVQPVVVTRSVVVSISATIVAMSSTLVLSDGARLSWTDMYAQGVVAIGGALHVGTNCTLSFPDTNVLSSGANVELLRFQQPLVGSFGTVAIPAGWYLIVPQRADGWWALVLTRNASAWPWSTGTSTTSATPPSETTAPNAPSTELDIIVGASVGGGVLLIVVVVVLVVVFRVKKLRDGRRFVLPIDAGVVSGTDDPSLSVADPLLIGDNEARN